MKNIFIFIFFLPFLSLSQTIVNIEETGGVYQIPCEVNGLNLKFIFDTGASDVSISKTEARFMLKYGYITKEDLIGRENYMMADGDIVEGFVINLKTVKIGDITLENIRASVIDSENAPLLLGQSVIKQLGDYKFDYDNNKLIISKGAMYDCLEGDCENGYGKIISSLGPISLDIIKNITEGKFTEGKLNGNGKHSTILYMDEKFFNETNKYEENIYEELFSKTLDENINIVKDYLGDGSKPEEGIFIFEYAGEFKNDKLLNGNINSITLDEFGDSIVTSIIPIKKGLINGDLKQYRSEDNKIRISGKVINSKKEGKHQRYYGNGEYYVLTDEENYLNGKLNGEQRGYSYDGYLTSKTNYLNGKKNGVFEYYEFNANSKEYLLSGYYEYKNGFLIKESDYDNGYNWGDLEYFTSEGIPGVANKNKNGVIVKKIGSARIGIHNWDGKIEYTWEKKMRVEDNGRNRKKFEEKIYYKKSGNLYAERVYLYGNPTSIKYYYETGELMMIAHDLRYLQRSNYTQKVMDKFYYKNGNLMLETPPLILFRRFIDTPDSWYRKYSQNFPEDFPEGSTYSGTAYHDDGSKLFDFKFISTKERGKMTDKSSEMWLPTYNDLFDDYEKENGNRSTMDWLFDSRAGLNTLNGLKINNIFYKNGEIQSVLKFDEKTGLQYISCYNESGNKKTCDKKELNTISRLIYHLLQGGSL